MSGEIFYNVRVAAHIPVLLNRVLEILGDVSGATILDATFGAGGYSREILRRGAKVIAFDRDPSIAPFADALKKQYPDQFTFINDKFSNIISHITYHISHIIFDVGVSSMQLDTPERGFSWRFDAPLDMRMEMDGGGETAAEMIEDLAEADLTRILRDYGCVKEARAIARSLKAAPPKTTFELRDAVFDPRERANAFQALRIAVNDELGELSRALDAVPALLAPGGICACITFHSLEHRIVKQKFLDWTAELGDPRLPQADGQRREFQLLRPRRPDAAEIAANPRARSSCLRAVRKIDKVEANKEEIL